MPGRVFFFGGGGGGGTGETKQKIVPWGWAWVVPRMCTPKQGWASYNVYTV